MQDFIRISKYAGMRNDLAQAGGGNTSVKLDGQIMLVKSSGFQLADVNENTGYSKIDYRLIEEYFKENIQAGEQSVLYKPEIRVQQHSHIRGRNLHTTAAIHPRFLHHTRQQSFRNALSAVFARSIVAPSSRSWQILISMKVSSSFSVNFMYCMSMNLLPSFHCRQIRPLQPACSLCHYMTFKTGRQEPDRHKTTNSDCVRRILNQKITAKLPVLTHTAPSHSPPGNVPSPLHFPGLPAR